MILILEISPLKANVKREKVDDRRNDRLEVIRHAGAGLTISATNFVGGVSTINPTVTTL